ncbi:MAG: NAD+ synthase [Verrucomicrobia bacterium]|jgi:NAD+ synthetase|nr:NAD+ synthase [Verrucomicrobiota bacterium]
MKIGVLQLNATVGDFAGNGRRATEGYRQACQQGAQFVLAPELFLCGYPPRDLLLRDDFVERGMKALESLAAHIGAVPLCLGVVLRHRGTTGRPLHNSAVILQHGRMVFQQHKALLPTYDVFDEDRYFEPGGTFPVFTHGGRRLGITICEDIWNDADFWPERRYARDPVKELITSGADLILNLSASPWHVGKEHTRLAMLQRAARDEGLALVQANSVGANDELIFDGNSVALDARGRVLARCAAFEEEVRVVDLAEKHGEAQTAGSPDEEMLYRALTLGIRDYVRKCGFQRVVIGLSGGIDSAVTAVLAAEALGADQVMGVSMPARYSSEGSRTDAAKLAATLGIRYEVLPVEEAFQAMERQLKGMFAGLQPDITEENIQSRLRGVTLMALSNKFGGLVLTTGNKSEMAVGYCTLYGDMCGALAVIADVFKTDVYRLARWINREREIIPASTIHKPPSAELRPNQKDQDSLPPYEVLDSILHCYVVEHLSPSEIVRRGHDPAVVTDVINKVTFSEYKRRQAAPGLKVSPRAFGMGRRIPVAQRFRAGEGGV